MLPRATAPGFLTVMVVKSSRMHSFSLSSDRSLVNRESFVRIRSKFFFLLLAAVLYVKEDRQSCVVPVIKSVYDVGCCRATGQVRLRRYPSRDGLALSRRHN